MRYLKFSLALTLLMTSVNLFSGCSCEEKQTWTAGGCKGGFMYTVGTFNVSPTNETDCMAYSGQCNGKIQYFTCTWLR